MGYIQDTGKETQVFIEEEKLMAMAATKWKGGQQVHHIIRNCAWALMCKHAHDHLERRYGMYEIKLMEGGVLVTFTNLPGKNFDEAVKKYSEAHRTYYDFVETLATNGSVLEAVGVDPDQDILPIDELDALGAVDLTSWTNCAPDWFPELPEADAMRARRSVFKWYAVMSVWPDAPLVQIEDGPSFDSAVGAERLLPLEEQLLEHPSSLLSRPYKAYVIGDLWQGDLSGLTVEDATETESFVLDCSRGIVYFDTPVMKVDTAEVPSQAEISLVCTFRIRNEDNNEYHRYRYSVDTGTNADADAGEDVVIVPDKYLWYRYDIDTEEWEDNLSDIKEQAEQMAECYLQSFANIPQGEQEWVGLIPFPVQGNIHMMRWLVAANRCLTYGYKNVESALIAPVHHERRMREIAQGVLV